jgi:hypothetical protein
MAKLKMEAFRAGVHKLPIEEDPRLKGVLAEVDRGVSAVAQMEPKRT